MLEIPPGSVNAIQGHGEICTTWLDPCIGVVVYDDSVKDAAVVAHMQGIYSEKYRALAELIEKIHSLFTGTRHLRAVVRGANFWYNYGDGEKEHLIKQVRILKRVLVKNKIRKIDVEIGLVDHITRVGFNVSKKHLIYEKRKMER